MGKFKVGEMVRVLKKNYGDNLTGRIGKISRVAEKSTYTEEYCALDIATGGVYSTDLQKIKGGTMSKYEELKSRIEGLNNGCDKEADDILMDIHSDMEASGPKIAVWMNTGCNVGSIESSYTCGKYGGEKVVFRYAGQCEKMGAFRKALIWFLAKSNLKNNLVGTEQKIEIEGKVYKAKIVEEA